LDKCFKCISWGVQKSEFHPTTKQDEASEHLNKNKQKEFIESLGSRRFRGFLISHFSYFAFGSATEQFLIEKGAATEQITEVLIVNAT